MIRRVVPHFFLLSFVLLLAFVSFGYSSFSAKKAFNYLPKTNKKELIVRHKAYVLCYQEAYEQAKWVAYRLTKEMVETGNEERTDNFRVDPSVASGSASPDDYKKQGYDKGHLCPAGDMSWDADAMSESFFMSNMSPQRPAFNRGIWKKLESAVRDWAKRDGEIFIVAAGVLKPGLETIGENKVAVPELYYKVILDNQLPEKKTIGFVFPNEGSKKDLFDFAVSVDSVEKLTGIDFFPALPDKDEKKLEANFDEKLWEK